MFLHLGFIDLCVLFVYLASAVVIGLWVSGKQSSLESYVLGDRDLPWWAILGSIVATETSTATVLSVPGLAYGQVGMTFLQLALGYIVGRTIIVYTLLPLYFRGQILTAYEVLDQRFGGLTKRFSSLLFLITRNFGDGLRLYLAAVVLQELAQIPFVLSVVLMGLVTIVYTYFGGIRSVVWNDCVQFLIYVLGGIVAVFVIVDKIPGGWEELTQFATAHQKLQIFQIDGSLANPYSLLAGLVGGAFLTIGTHGADHMMVQRYLSARSQADAGKALILSGFVVFAQFALFLFIGVELACYYASAGEFSGSNDKVFAHFIVNVFPKNIGLVGLLLAAILAAAMSTLSSSLNSSASALVNDFYVAFRRTPASAEHLFTMTRTMTIVFGIVQIGVGILAQALTKSVVDNALAIAGLTFGLLLGVFALGLWTKRVDQGDALTGMFAGLTLLVFIMFGLNGTFEWISVCWKSWFGTPKPDVVIAHTWYALIGSVTTFAVGYGASWLWPRRTIA